MTEHTEIINVSLSCDCRELTSSWNQRTFVIFALLSTKKLIKGPKDISLSQNYVFKACFQSRYWICNLETNTVHKKYTNQTIWEGHIWLIKAPFSLWKAIFPFITSLLCLTFAVQADVLRALNTRLHIHQRKEESLHLWSLTSLWLVVMGNHAAFTAQNLRMGFPVAEILDMQRRKVSGRTHIEAKVKGPLPWWIRYGLNTGLVEYWSYCPLSQDRYIFGHSSEPGV